MRFRTGRGSVRRRGVRGRTRRTRGKRIRSYGTPRGGVRL